jgi:ornithine carbamoyltransferase
MLRKKSLISIKDLTKEELGSILGLAKKVKRKPNSYKNALSGKTVALIFQKPSSRTRVSFEAGMRQLGGHAIYLDESHIKFGHREPVKDIAATLSRYVDGIIARTFSHEDLIELGSHASIPVINGLSNLLHPCQALGDMFTILERVPNFKKVKLVYLGDGNNVLHSLIHVAGKMGMPLTIATPKGYEPNKDILEYGKSLTDLTLLNDAMKAVEGADIIYTDVWASMGQEGEHEKRLASFSKFQVNSALVSVAKKNCLIMHCLPAHRGEEITDSVLEGPNSIVFDQAENRLHVQKAILILLLGK